ncbi:hypothetical protein COU59_00560 [Candidatus Pacearchaeota archaeon CG10_big_fil_rev_8_21_14_0_10_34_12]|nr:MAG: hypothetical protein COU59_00560 [Candidatus Pacearchaeota archaeon CG10_big_fil_rev_8_21_14_0_10_34_12]
MVNVEKLAKSACKGFGAVAGLAISSGYAYLTMKCMQLTIQENSLYLIPNISILSMLAANTAVTQWGSEELLVNAYNDFRNAFNS